MLDVSTLPSLSGSPRVGDIVLWPRDTLVEVARPTPGLPPTWLCIPRGAEGKVLGYRDRNEESFAIVEVDGFDKRTVVYVRETKLATGAPTHARESSYFGAQYFGRRSGR
jgi:hypothetical protein